MLWFHTPSGPSATTCKISSSMPSLMSVTTTSTRCLSTILPQSAYTSATLWVIWYPLALASPSFMTLPISQVVCANCWTQHTTKTQALSSLSCACVSGSTPASYAYLAWSTSSSNSNTRECLISSPLTLLSVECSYPSCAYCTSTGSCFSSRSSSATLSWVRPKTCRMTYQKRRMHESSRFISKVASS